MHHWSPFAERATQGIKGQMASRHAEVSCDRSNAVSFVKARKCTDETVFKQIVLMLKNEIHDAIQSGSSFPNYCYCESGETKASFTGAEFHLVLQAE
jgi:hypothetical protein